MRHIAFRVLAPLESLAALALPVSLRDLPHAFGRSIETTRDGRAVVGVSGTARPANSQQNEM